MVRHLLGRRSESGFLAEAARDCFRIAVTDLGSRIVRAWSIVPAAVSERDAGPAGTRARPARPAR